MLSYKLFLIILLLIILIVLTLIQPLQSNNIYNEMLIEKYESERKDTQELFKKHTKEKNIWYHDPYTYTYASSEYKGRTTDDFLLTFLCVKFEGRTENEWGDYSDPAKYLQENIRCKTTIHDLDSKSTPTDIDKIKEIINDDLHNEMLPYTKLTGTSILAPVYCILFQYPNKYHSGDGLEGGYNYNDLMSGNKPYERVHYSNKKTRTNFMCNEGRCIDTKMILVYPMYDKDSINFYKTSCDKYLLNELPRSIKLFENLSEDEKNIKQKPNFQGIVEFIKDLNKNGLKINKEKNCFIQCNDTSKLYCGCATRFDGVENPIDNTEKKDYKSYCKDLSENEKFSNYCFVYRINELMTDNITDIGIGKEIEDNITHYLTNRAC